jgi:hypothetical protein
MSFPLPAARLIVRYLDDSDLVRQRELYPLDVAQVLRQRRLARKTLRRWRSLVLVQQAVRNAGQLEHLSLNDMRMTEANLRTVREFQERGIDGNSVIASLRSKDVKVLEEQVRQLIMRDDPALDAVLESCTPEDYVRALAQSPALPALLGLFN